MLLSTAQANGIFDIIVAKGNFDNTNESYTDYKRAEFVESLTTGNGIAEYWYSSACGASLKLYFQDGFTSLVSFVAQTYNPIHEKTLVADMNEALNEWMGKQQ